MSLFFSETFTPNGSAKAVDSAEVDRHVHVRCASSFQVGFDVTEAQTGYTVVSSLDFVLPAGKELWLYAGAVNISILVSGSPG